jgi:hypothetical protein
MPAEDVPMRNPLLGQRIHQCNGDVVLPRNIRKTLGPVFSSKNLISHRREHNQQ